MRVSTSAVVEGLAPADLYAVAADLRNLPAWWIEHLHAEVVSTASRLRDARYEVRYRLPWGVVIGATCTVVAARTSRSLTYMWEGGGIRLAVGQDFDLDGSATRTRLVADVHVRRLLRPLAPVLLPLMRRELEGEIERALATLVELAAARAVVRSTSTARTPDAGRPEARTVSGLAETSRPVSRRRS